MWLHCRVRKQSEPKGLQSLYTHVARSPQKILWALGRLGRVSSVVLASLVRGHFHLLLGSRVLNFLPATWLHEDPSVSPHMP